MRGSDTTGFGDFPTNCILCPVVASACDCPHRVEAVDQALEELNEVGPTCQTRDEWFNDCVLIHLPTLERIAVARGLRADERDDMIQNVCVNVLEYLNSGGAAPRNFEHWLVKIAIRESINLLRQKAREPARIRIWIERYEPTIVGEQDRFDLLDHAIDALERLPVKLKDVTKERLLNGRSAKEIAEEFGIKPTTVYARLKKALHLLKSLLRNI